MSAGFTPLAASVFAFALWMVGTNLWTNPYYTAAAPYHAAFLFGGFLLGRRAGAENGRVLFGAALAFALGLAAWAIWQRIGEGVARSHALFETPATLTTTINLVLLPGLAVLAWGKRGPFLVAALVVLSAALAVGTSRGGWLALAVGGLTAVMYGRRAGIRPDWKSAAMVTTVLATGWAGAWLAALAWDWTFAAIREPVHSIVGSEAVESSFARLGLYELAWRGIAPSSLFAGFGYLGFYYLLEAGRQGLPTYGAAITYFVHNDYLQTLLELGIPGLAGLVAVVTLPLVAAWRTAPRIAVDPTRRLVLVALVASLSSMATHALVDFPFYIPVCLLIYGTALGVLDSIVLRAALAGSLWQPANLVMVRTQKAGIAAIATLWVWILATPVAAEAAAGYAQRQWRGTQGESAAYWFELARRLEPRDWRYHWYTGQFWFAQAAQNGKPVAAGLADNAFATGFTANSREVRNLLGRIETHRRLGALLTAPADAATLHAWADRAVELAPLDPEVRAERARVLAQFPRPATQGSK